MRAALNPPLPAAAFAGLLAFCLPLACGRIDSRASVVLITIDTLRADHLGCYGYSRPTSPHIDRLARQGILFEKASTSLPRTTQSIASILSGRYPKSHGARGLFSSVSQTNVMLAEILKDAGYATAAFVSNVFLQPGQGFEQGFDRYDNPEGRWDGDSAAEVTSAALLWLERRPAGKPFFLWVHYLDPHWTYAPGPPFDRAFDTDFEGPFTLYADLDARRLTKGQVIFENRLAPRQVKHLVALYDGEIAQVDAALAPLLETVRAGPRPTLIVLTSDHGESLGEHNYYFAHGEYLYEPGLRIPLLISWPGRIPSGVSSGALAQNIDIAPTILGLLGIDRLQSVDGRPLLIPERDAAGRESRRFHAAPGRGLVFAESDYQLIHPENRRYYIPGPAGKWSSAADGRHKLIHIPTVGGEILELYDLTEDPLERHNRAGAEGDPTTWSRLLRELRQFVDYDTGATHREIDRITPEERQRLRSLGYVN